MTSLIISAIILITISPAVFVTSFNDGLHLYKAADKFHRMFVPSFVVYLIAIIGYYISTGLNWSIVVTSLYIVLAVKHIRQRPTEERVPLELNPRKTVISKASITNLYWLFNIGFINVISLVIAAQASIPIR